ncbi:MAG: hypothetical protein ACFE8J_13215 [Candidatus Heimdallarchaeota archaeon]
MAKGFIITKWTEDQGLVVYHSYPENLTVDLDDMMRIFYAHITGAGEAGNVVVRLEKAKSNVSSYFTGMESTTPLMINLMLELGEDPEMFGEAVISEINKKILQYIQKMTDNVGESYEIRKELIGYMKDALLLLERLKNLSKEQRMAQIFSSERLRTILEMLQERAYSRGDLRSLIEEKTGRFITNLEIALDPFVKTDIIKQDWIEGDSDITLFLLSDFTIMRIPAENLIENAKKNLPTPELAKKYMEEVSRFFSDYEPNFEDNLKVALNMINPDKYDFITLFRERAYPINKIPKGPGESFEEIRAFLKSLEDDKILALIKDNANMEWVFLLTDPVAYTFYPEYLIENIRKDVSEKRLRKNTAIKHLELLEQVYKK